MAEYTLSSESWTGIFATDSQSLLDTLESINQKVPAHQVTTGNSINGVDVLSPEWDVVMQIHAHQ